MRKVIFIIAVGVVVGLFPLLALPPRAEAWILLVIGLGIIIFGMYEYLVFKERKNNQTSSSQVTSTPLDEHVELDTPTS